MKVEIYEENRIDIAILSKTKEVIQRDNTQLKTIRQADRRADESKERFKLDSNTSIRGEELYYEFHYLITVWLSVGAGDG